MPIEIILLTTLAALTALGFVFFKYFYGNKNYSRNTYVMGFLRFISIFTLLLLLINPEIDQIDYEIEKPQLFLALDRSESMEYLETADSATALITYLENNPGLQERFNIQKFGFGQNISRLNEDSLVFNEEHTNISSALKDLSKLHSSGEAAVVLITDGNQTIGEDFQYFKPKTGFNIYPVVAGDTTAQVDISITNLNVNKYAFLNNNFPVEIFINYTGDIPVLPTLEIKAGDRILFTKSVSLDKRNSSLVINTTLPAQNLGSAIYSAELSALEGEKNTTNNISRFGVEVIDERTSVLILTDVSHPDIGMFKRSIESNEQRQVAIQQIEEFDISEIKDFQLVILYQPNNKFKSVAAELLENNINFLLVTGTKSDWNFINSMMPLSKDFTSQSQEFIPIFNPNYSTFQFDDIGFEDFPPLEDAFGTVEFLDQNYNSLLFQQMEGINTKSPLLATFENNSSRYAVLFGENSWKWRAQTYIDKGSFEDFDTFLGKLIQFLASAQTRERLTVDAESFYFGNEEIEISAQYFDQNYQFDPGGQLRISILDTTASEQMQAPMLLNNNRYSFTIDGLSAGDYSFEIEEQTSGLSRSGSFSVIAYNAEQQFTSSNFSKLKNLASHTSGRVYYLSKNSPLVKELLEDNRYVNVQKSHKKTVPLIDWKFLLIIIILSLSTEWFMRKYFGLI